MSRSRHLFAFVLSVLFVPSLRADPLPGTKELTEKANLAAKMVEGIDKYLMRELEALAKNREIHWKVDLSSVEAYLKSVAPKRERLKKLIGVVDERVKFTDLEYVAGPKTPALVAETDDYKVFAVRWPVLPGVNGEGLLLEPKGKVVACIVALPDADWTPEMLVGLVPGVPKEHQFARRLAENGCRVIVPVLIDRKDTWSGNEKLGKMTNQPHREFIYRMAFEMGRHIIGYEVQKVLAAVDWFCQAKDHPPVGIIGYGEGGLVTFYSGAIDERIKVTMTCGYFGPRHTVWEDPIYRNTWGSLREFGDAEVALLFPPRRLWAQCGLMPEIAGPPLASADRRGAAPGRLIKRDYYASNEERNRAYDVFKDAPKDLRPVLRSVYATLGPIVLADDDSLEAFLKDLGVKSFKKDTNVTPKVAFKGDHSIRQKRQFDQLVAFTQKLKRDAEGVRQKDFWDKLDRTSPEKYEASCKPLRDKLWEEVIGKLPKPTLPMNPRTRQVYDEPRWTGYDVVLDLYPDVVASGILLLPKDLKKDEKRPVVVCQHGLEGTPRSCIDEEKRRTYNRFAAKLADLGYIVYCPQNPYIGGDKFRVLQRKANPLGLSLFSFIVRQHERTIDFLETLPNVDKEKIAFYGLSYGGKTAMRVPALLPRYCLSICSGDFNEWIWKNVSYDFKGSYMYTGEYEMPEFNLGNTFGYAEMAALIAPRPFMVERGHDDGVGIDEWVAYEFAKVRRHYSRLKIADRTEIEFFDGVHEIHGKGTFRFLKKHLAWPK